MKWDRMKTPSNDKSIKCLTNICVYFGGCLFGAKKYKVLKDRGRKASGKGLAKFIYWIFFFLFFLWFFIGMCIKWNVFTGRLCAFLPRPCGKNSCLPHD